MISDSKKTKSLSYFYPFGFYSFLYELCTKSGILLGPGITIHIITEMDFTIIHQDIHFQHLSIKIDPAQNSWLTTPVSNGDEFSLKPPVNITRRSCSIWFYKYRNYSKSFCIQLEQYK